MDKLVPDPPYKPSAIFSIHPTLPAIDALAHASELAKGIEDTLDEYCCANAGEPGLGMLVNAAHTTQMLRALLEHIAKHP
ncbi:hypothetical protein P0Y43_08670 [Pseudomonas entomophila]|uniref:hypothetical protein n=1 Tax=Pseudomonas entomophila TaxID=312306 RepID=UPI0023D82C8E|nr:hypothetical protein [Pseudomonas entomophila]MDF0730803.1 hypothetical protein [Pseudomonas entomophila]